MMEDRPTTYGIQGRNAPPWGVETWFNLPESKQRLDVHDFGSKVLYLYCFQSWCPGCHSSGFPTLQAMLGEYEGNHEVTFVAIQTVFEGFDANTLEKAQSSCSVCARMWRDGTAGPLAPSYALGVPEPAG